MFEKDEDYRKAKSKCKARITKAIKVWSGREEAIRDASFKDGAEFGYNKANEWHNLNENSNDLPDEGEWVEGLYIWYYKDEPQWDTFKVRWFYEIGELDEKLVRWYSSDDPWNKVDEPDYWRKITLPTRNEYDRNH